MFFYMRRIHTKEFYMDLNMDPQDISKLFQSIQDRELEELKRRNEELKLLLRNTDNTLHQAKLWTNTSNEGH